MRELVDLRDIESIEASTSTFKDVILSDRAHQEKLRGMRTAIIAPTNALYGLSTMYATLADLNESPSTVKVFRTVDEAKDWLGLREPERP